MNSDAGIWTGVEMLVKKNLHRLSCFALALMGAVSAGAQTASTCTATQSLGGMICNVANQAIQVGDVLPAALCYLFGSLALFWAGYAVLIFSKHKGRDPGSNTPGKAALLLFAGAALLYAPTWLNIGISSAVPGSAPQAVIK